MSKILARKYAPEPRQPIPATDWKHIDPPTKRRLNVLVAIEKLEHSRRLVPEHFESCGCQSLLSIVKQAKDEKEKYIHVEMMGERVNENGINMVRFTYSGQTFEIGGACFEETELSS